MNENKHRTLAHKFSDEAELFLLSYDFELINDPTAVYSPYQASRALYKSLSNFYLAFFFDPYDGRSAGINCGRQFTSRNEFLGEKNHFFGLSASYYELAKMFGISVSAFYSIGGENSIDDAISSILLDLEASLETVTSSTTTQILQTLENSPRGILRRLEGYNLQPDTDILISEYNYHQS